VNFKVEASLLGGNNVSDKSDIRFRFTQSPSGSISGIAFEENGDIVASFKLNVERGSIYMCGKSWSSVNLTMVSKALGVKVYDIFDGILSKYGEREIGCQTWRIGRTRCLWRIRNDQVKKAIEEVKKTLEKRKINFLARAANNQTTRVSPVERDSGLNK
jgi:hypothetical protein